MITTLLLFIQTQDPEPTGLRSLSDGEIAQGIILGLIGYWLWRRAKKRNQS